MKQISENITTLELLGSGGMGHVYKAIYKRGDFEKVVAVKELIDSSSEGINEAKILAGLSHPNISSVLDFISNENGNFLVMEFIEGVPLSKVKDLTSANINYVIYKILGALEYLKSKNIIHHDISPDNIILGKHGEVKLIDFGVSKEFQNDEKSVNLSGKIRYLDPRIIQNKSKYDFEADLFSLGVIYYELITKQKLFSGDFNEVLQDLLKFKELNEYDLENIEGKERNIISGLLVLEKSERLNLQEVLDFFKAEARESCEIELSEKELSLEHTVVTGKVKNRNGRKYLIFVLLGLVGLIVKSIIKKNPSYFYYKNEVLEAPVTSRKELRNPVEFKSCLYMEYLLTNEAMDEEKLDYIYKTLIKYCSLDKRVIKGSRESYSKKNSKLWSESSNYVELTFEVHQEIKKVKTQVTGEGFGFNELTSSTQIQKLSDCIPLIGYYLIKSNYSSSTSKRLYPKIETFPLVVTHVDNPIVGAIKSKPAVKINNNEFGFCIYSFDDKTLEFYKYKKANTNYK